MEPQIFNRPGTLRQKDDWTWTIDQLKVRVYADGEKWFWSIKYADFGGFCSKNSYSELRFAVHAVEDVLVFFKLELQTLTRYPSPPPACDFK